MQRYLVIANQTLGADQLYGKVRECQAAGACTFHIVVPATPPNENLTWDEGEAAAIARERLDRALVWFRELGAQVDGEVGGGPAAANAQICRRTVSDLPGHRLEAA